MQTPHKRPHNLLAVRRQLYPLHCAAPSLYSINPYFANNPLEKNTHLFKSK
uniref:Uncharacterized protein n=1 Tax=Anguilla anguilla TaxID=7936 RepID=A0A0E9XXE7_ANGAN